jgi:hypothetical protein
LVFRRRGKRTNRIQGPENPSAEVQTIYDKDGNEHKATLSNARELVMSGDYTWVPAHAVTDTGVDTETSDEHATAPAESVVSEEPPAEDSLDPMNSPLTKIAEKVVGDPDVVSYLSGFTADTLREYGFTSVWREDSSSCFQRNHY